MPDQQNTAYSQKKSDSSVPGVLRNDRPQPHNLDAERAVLGAMLLEPTPCIDLAVENLKSENVFYSPAHRAIYSCLCELHNDSAGIDIILVVHTLSMQGKLEEIGGELYLVELQNSIATTANLESWCEIINQFSILRGMINVCSEAMVKCYDTDTETDALLDSIEKAILDVRYENKDSSIKDFKEHVKESFEYLHKILRKEITVGIPTGYPDLDKLVTGLKPGEMFVLAARPSIGKTSMALNLLKNVALTAKNVPVAFFSLEMTAEQITRRLLCTEAKVPESVFYDHSFKNSDMPKLTKAVSSLKQAKIYIDPTPGLKILELRAKARRLKSQFDIQLVVVDYLQLMKAGGKVDNRQQEVAEISSGIKALAMELKIPVLVLAQLNRDIEKAGSGAKARPKLSHLRESGAIEQDADIVTFLHRDRDAQKELTKEAATEGVEAELIVEKNRNGQTGIVQLRFIPNLMEFRSVEHRYGDDDMPG